MVMVKVKMCRLQCLLVLCLSFSILDCYALTCRIKTAPNKESELKRIYNACLRKQEQRNYTEGQKNNEEQTWSTTRGYTPKTTLDRERTTKQNERTTDKNKHKESIGVTDAMTSRYELDYTRDDGNEESTEGETGSDTNQGLYSNDRSNGGEYRQGDDYSEDSPQFENDRSLSKRSGRQKREKRNEMNSGQRSQYNPNTRKHVDDNDSRRTDEHTTRTNDGKDFNDNPCALQCFMETLKMTDDSGLPDKYLVTQAITKDIQNEELKDFLQESTEECFEILRANKDDKCEFSKNLLMCLSDKGKANCDDWKDDMQF